MKAVGVPWSGMSSRPAGIKEALSVKDMLGCEMDDTAQLKAP